MSAISLSPTRRELLAATAAAGALSLLPRSLRAAAGDESIRPFTVNFPEEELADLRRRVAATQLARPGDRHRRIAGRAARDDPEARAATGRRTTTGARCEARLNALPQFITEIDGLDIHFIHVRSKHENALPVIITHGWPGSIIEQLKIIEPLTNPTAHGGTAADAFHVVIPSLPGHGFSGKPTAPGWTPVTHRPGLGDADAAPRLHEIRGAGRRLGQRRLRADGPAAAAGIARHPHQHGGDGSGRHLEGARVPRGAARPISAPTSATPGTSSSTSTSNGLGYALEMTTARRRSTASRIRRSGWRPGCSTTTSAATS